MIIIIIAARRQDEFKIVCYYGAWSVYRPEPYNFKVSDIDPFSCTHVIYSFAGLDAETLTIVSLDKEEDIVKGILLHIFNGGLPLKKQSLLIDL